MGEQSKHENVLDSMLWKQIEATCTKIVSSKNRSHWAWLKEFVLSSNIWYKQINKKNDTDDDEKQNVYLYEKLLEQSEDSDSVLYKIGPLTVLDNGMAPINDDYFDKFATRPRSDKKETVPQAQKFEKTPSLAPYSIEESMVLSYDDDDDLLKANSLTNNFLKRERDTTMKFSENLMTYKDNESALLSDIFQDHDDELL